MTANAWITIVVLVQIYMVNAVMWVFIVSMVSKYLKEFPKNEKAIAFAKIDRVMKYCLWLAPITFVPTIVGLFWVAVTEGTKT